MLSNRRKILKGLTATGALAVAGPAVITQARAADLNYKIGSSMPVAHPFTAAMADATKKINEKAGGRLQIAHFPASQLGGDTDLLSQVRSGALEIYASTNTFMSTLAPATAISGIAFAFSNADQVWKAMDGKLGAFIAGEIQKAGLHCLPTFWENGFRQITTSKRPVKTVSDLSGLKIRVPVNPLSISLFKSLGAAPVAMNFAELYSALQTGVADGQENPLVLLDTGKLYEVQKFCALSNHIWEGTPLVANSRAWAALPDNLKEIVTTELTAAAKIERKAITDANAGLQGRLEKLGMTFNAVDTPSFRAKLRESGYYGEWKAKYGNQAWGVLEESIGAQLG